MSKVQNKLAQGNLAGMRAIRMKKLTANVVMAIHLGFNTRAFPHLAPYVLTPVTNRQVRALGLVQADYLGFTSTRVFATPIN